MKLFLTLVLSIISCTSYSQYSEHDNGLSITSKELEARGDRLNQVYRQQYSFFKSLREEIEHKINQMPSWKFKDYRRQKLGRGAEDYTREDTASTVYALERKKYSSQEHELAIARRRLNDHMAFREVYHDYNQIILIPTRLTEEEYALYVEKISSLLEKAFVTLHLLTDNPENQTIRNEYNSLIAQAGKQIENVKIQEEINVQLARQKAQLQKKLLPQE